MSAEQNCGAEKFTLRPDASRDDEIGSRRHARAKMSARLATTPALGLQPCLAGRADGALAALLDDGTVAILSIDGATADHARGRPARGGGAQAVACSADGALLAVASASALGVYELVADGAGRWRARLRWRAQLRAHARALALASSASAGVAVAVGGAPGLLLFGDAAAAAAATASAASSARACSSTAAPSSSAAPFARRPSGSPSPRSTAGCWCTARRRRAGSAGRRR